MSKERRKGKEPANRRPILIIEDEPLNMKLFTLTLAKRGYRVLQAADGYHGFVMACDNNPGLIVMDVRLPGVSGLEVTRALKDSIYTKDIPIIIATAFLIDEAALRESGCDGYIPKPFALPQFIGLIDSLLAQPQAADEESTAAEEPAAAE
jgi:two-component system, cell cycle response regulator DivK